MYLYLPIKKLVLIQFKHCDTLYLNLSTTTLYFMTKVVKLTVKIVQNKCTFLTCIKKNLIRFRQGDIEVGFVLGGCYLARPRFINLIIKIPTKNLTCTQPAVAQTTNIIFCSTIAIADI